MTLAQYKAVNDDGKRAALKLVKEVEEEAKGDAEMGLHN